MERPGPHPVGHMRQQRSPYRIGILSDLPDLDGLSNAFVDGIRLGLEYCEERRLVDRAVELVVREVYAQPWTDAVPVLDAHRELVEVERVLGVAGPMTTDNSLALLAQVERAGVPTLTICGSQLYVGTWAFNLSNGGMGDEPALMANWLADQGHRRVAVIFDAPSQIGAEYLPYFRRSCALLGVTLTCEVGLSPVPAAEESREAFARAQASSPDALAFFSFGHPTTARLARASMASLAWDPPRVVNTAFVGAGTTPELLEFWDGWVGVDQIHEANQVFATVLEMWQARFGYRPFNSVASVGWDIGHSFGIALGRMRTATPEGFGGGLETIRRLPAATGGPGTIITFGPQDHRGFKGADFLLLRRAEAGRNVLEGTVPVVF
jgi:branched-chain amino acid transport system substrate-binding protein